MNVALVHATMNTKEKKRKGKPTGFGNTPVHDPLRAEVSRKNDDTARQADVLPFKRENAEFDLRKRRKP